MRTRVLCCVQVGIPAYVALLAQDLRGFEVAHQGVYLGFSKLRRLEVRSQSTKCPKLDHFVVQGAPGGVSCRMVPFGCKWDAAGSVGRMGSGRGQTGGPK
jgi:hypothetical protein